MFKPKRVFLLQHFSEEEEIVETQTENQPDEAPYLTIQYDQEEKGLTEEEARTYAQKGMNYDRLSNKFEQLQNSPELKFMNNFLKENGYDSFSDYEKALEVDGIMKQRPGIDRETAEKILIANQVEAKEKEEEKKRESEQAEEDRKEKMYIKFFEKYNDVEPETIPEEVWEMVNDGADLSMAYELHFLREGTDRTKIEQEVLKKVANSGKTNTSSAAGGASHKNGYKDMADKDFNALVESVKRGEV